MGLVNFWKEKAKRLGYIEIGLIKLSCIAFGLMLAAWIPALTRINGGWWLLIALLAAIEPLITVYKK